MQGQAINEAACSIAKEVASEGDALVAGGIWQRQDGRAARVPQAGASVRRE